MTRVLRSAVKKNQVKKDSSSNLSINTKSKPIKRSAKKRAIIKCRESRQNDVWGISSIINNIFAYTEFKDLIKLNTVCKKWNNITNPIIHRSIKLQRRRAFQNKDHDKRFNKEAKTDVEVEMCISNNSKHAEYIKEFKFDETLQPQRVIQIFETFRFISNLTIEGVYMYQDQFISMITPLTQLQELNLKKLGISRNNEDSYITKPAVLPPSLTKLSLGMIGLYGDPELFIQTINSHKNLIEFRLYEYTKIKYIEPFFKNYPTLKALEFCYIQQDKYETITKIFECNSQLTSLVFGSSRFNSNFLSNINHHLTNLEELGMIDRNRNAKYNSPIISKFSQPTKIKKLNLSTIKLSECTVNSILQNCPELEELILSPYVNYKYSISNISFRIPGSAKLKKLHINGESYSQSSLNSVLNKCSHLRELDIRLPKEWKECIKLIGNTCTNLDNLTIWSPFKNFNIDMNGIFQDLHENEFLTSNSLYKSTLKQLTLNNFNIYKSKAEYFKNFPKLRTIEYRSQVKPNGLKSNIKTNFDGSLWPNYKLDINMVDFYSWHGKLTKINTYIL